MINALLFTLLVSLPQDAENHLKRDIDWQMQAYFVDEQATVKSMFTNREQIEKFIYLFDTSRRLFLQFTKDQCTLEPLEIRIITMKVMNSGKYFYFVTGKPYDFIVGRYFRDYNILYITPQALSNPEDFAHEVAHYMYDTCGISFANDEIEHRSIYKFEKYFLEHTNY